MVDLGFGVAGAAPPEVVRAVAKAAEEAGYRTFWANDTPDGDGLAALAAAAEATERIRLAVGVIPLDRRPAEAIAGDVARRGLPVERLILGVGSGRAAGGLERVRTGVTTIRDLTGARVIVGALGPRMCALAGEAADGALLNWLTPAFATGSAALVRQAADAAGRETPFVAGYVRSALGPAARERLAQEAARYESFPAYAAHFARMGAGALETAVAADDPGDIGRGLAAFVTLDEIVVRAIAEQESIGAYLPLLRAAVPAS
jgi:alkanesulfonate monooxygenase SsuD/methylene tetrahydromethanopterin reductase-like flavin-dependent oxidoreductase (luciferase family)